MLNSDPAPQPIRATWTGCGFARAEPRAHADIGGEYQSVFRPFQSEIEAKQTWIFPTVYRPQPHRGQSATAADIGFAGRAGNRRDKL
jgi:hypothetical protein